MQLVKEEKHEEELLPNVLPQVYFPPIPAKRSSPGSLEAGGGAQPNPLFNELICHAC